MRSRAKPTSARRPRCSECRRSTTSSHWVATRGAPCARRWRRSRWRRSTLRPASGGIGSSCCSRSRSVTTSTCTRASITRPTSATSSDRKVTRCCRTGDTCRSGTTDARERSSCRAPTWCDRADMYRHPRVSSSGRARSSTSSWNWVSWSAPAVDEASRPPSTTSTRTCSAWCSSTTGRRATFRRSSTNRSGPSSASRS